VPEHEARRRPRSAQRPARPVLVMNLKSGGGKAERFRLAEECEQRGIEPIVLRPGDDLRQLAQDAVDRGADVIGMAGGDGSQALVADGVDRLVDLASVNGRIFVNNASLGLYAKVIQSPEYRDAKLATTASVLPDVLGPGAVPLAVPRGADRGVAVRLDDQ
jgi:diacylglycerol kinase family enzyme